MKVDSSKLKDIATASLLQLGAAPEEAELVARGLVRADLRGIPSHGVNFLSKIVQRVEHGLLDLPTTVEIVSKNGSSAHLDGGNGLGMVAADKAMQLSIEMAGRQGTGFALVKNTNHVGLLALYTMQAAEAGMLGMCMSNAAASIAPTGGAEPFMGTNPMSLALPCASGGPILVDMSTSVVARGKIRRAQALGQNIPPGWALDASGLPTTEPGAAMEGSLLPIAGPKGSALALFVDLIAGMLSGSKFGKDVLTFHKPLGPTGVGVMTLAVDISKFMPLEQFELLAASHMETIRNSRKAHGVKRIYLPGEIEFEKEEAGRKYGVEMDPHVVSTLNELISKQKLNVAPIGE